MTGISDVLIFALIPAATIIGGGAIAMIHTPGPKLRSGIQHFAAGLVFAAVAVEILPDVLHKNKPIPAFIGFVIGVALMLLVKYLTDREQGESGQSNGSESSASLLLPLGIDVAIDGLLIGLSFAAGVMAGLLLTVALAVELMFLGLAAVVSLNEYGSSLWQKLGTCAALAGLMLGGAALGASSLDLLSDSIMEGVLSFGGAALLYLVTEELLVEAHKKSETPIQAAMFFVGFIALFLTEMVAK